MMVKKGVEILLEHWRIVFLIEEMFCFLRKEFKIREVLWSSIKWRSRNCYALKWSYILNYLNLVGWSLTSWCLDLTAEGYSVIWSYNFFVIMYEKLLQKKTLSCRSPLSTNDDANKPFPLDEEDPESFWVGMS